jgi:hypothetical protein
MTCIGQKTLTVTASATDFDTAVSVSPATADTLLVSVGEPTFDSGVNGFVLNSTNTHPLTRDPPGPVPSWTAELDNFAPAVSACIEVLEDGAQTTAAVTCTSHLDPEGLHLSGIRLAKATLDGLLQSQTGVFPVQGLVIGKALLATGAPAENVTITPSDPDHADILYLSDAGTFVGPPAMTATGTSGLWVSKNAPYGTVFHARQGATAAPDAYGGLIYGKATVVISQLPP